MNPARRRLFTAPLLAAVGCRRPATDQSNSTVALPPPPAAAPTSAPPVEIDAATLLPGGRVIVPHGRDVVEVRREEGRVAARSLLCTHWGCQVVWNDAARLYLCPCHEGRYDERGEVVAGPPTVALRVVPVRLDGQRIRIGKD